MAITGTCHCGAVSFELNDQPPWLTACNCSICRRLGTLWAHSKAGNVTIKAAPDATLRYIHGEKAIAFHTCKRCGCTTHWDRVDPESQDRMAVNFRLVDPSVVAKIRVRHFDGAESWQYLD